jgi:predicted nucleotidyltransferase
VDIEDDWLRDLAAWASKNDNVDEMWLFGSRTDGTGKPERDVDISPASLHQLVCGKITTGHSEISLP